MSTITILEELAEAMKFFKDTCGFNCSDPIAAAESTHYGAHTFYINKVPIQYRFAHTTPTKTGQFVTLWKRVGKGPIQPFDLSDEVGLFIVSVHHENQYGIFVFPKVVLHQKNILSDRFKDGKRAIRVYAPWDSTTNKQAQKTQQWQLNYFIEISGDKTNSVKRMQRFFAVE